MCSRDGALCRSEGQIMQVLGEREIGAMVSESQGKVAEGKRLVRSGSADEAGLWSDLCPTVL